MKDREYPKLHLPPWFYDEGWEEMVRVKEWFAGAFAELAASEFVRPTFITTDRIKEELDISGRGFWSDADVVVMKTASIEQISLLLPALSDSACSTACVAMMQSVGMNNPGSRSITAGVERLLNRAMLRVVRFTDVNFDKPVVGGRTVTVR